MEPMWIYIWEITGCEHFMLKIKSCNSVEIMVHSYILLNFQKSSITNVAYIFFIIFVSMLYI